MRLCAATFGGLHRFDGEWITLDAHYNVPPEELEYLERHVFPFRAGQGSANGRAVLGRATVHVHDVLSDAEYRLATPTTYRTVLSVPMLQERRPTGAITLWRRELRPFSDKQIQLVTTFADQAVIAIENVRLFTELQEKNRALTEAHAQVSEALDQQTATREILDVISRSPTDVQPVFDTIVESARRLCEATFSVVFLLEHGQLTLAAVCGVDPAGIAAIRRAFPSPPGRDTTSGRAVRERRLVHIEDTSVDSEYTFSERGALGIRSILAVPMLREGIPFGVITVWRSEVRPFSDKQIALMQTFANQAVIAIENVRLFQELQDRTRELGRSVEELKALGEVSQAVSSSLDLETVLNTIVARAVQLAAAHGGVIYEYDETKQQFDQIKGSHGLDEELSEVIRAAPIRLGEGVSGRAAALLAPVQIPDVLDDRTYDVARIRAVFQRHGYRSLLAVPLLFEQRIIGVLTVWRQESGEFAPDVVKLLQTFATQSVLAIQNARLFREIADKSRQLEAASRHKSDFLANMSHELRTPLNAIIGFSGVLAERMFGEVNEKQAEYLQDILSSGRHLLSLINDILDLSKAEAGRLELELGRFHLPTALDNALTPVRERASRHGITLDLAVDPEIGEILADERKIKQILLNLLSNAVKFTPEGGRVGLTATAAEDVITIAVSDTGIGITPEDQEAIFEEFRQVGSGSQKQEGTGLGLTLTKKFVELHGGRIGVQSQVGQGATFTFTLPVQPQGRGSSDQEGGGVT